MRGEGREEKKGREGRGEGRGGEGREGGEGRGEEAFLVMWPRRVSALNPPLGNT